MLPPSASQRSRLIHAVACITTTPGTSYIDFIHSLHLPEQLAKVDPIVASFCGGAVGVVSALLVIEVSIHVVV